jgi:hypothetical protein
LVLGNALPIPELGYKNTLRMSLNVAKWKCCKMGFVEPSYNRGRGMWRDARRKRWNAQFQRKVVTMQA